MYLPYISVILYYYSILTPSLDNAQWSTMFSVIGFIVNPRTGITGDVGPLTAYSKSPKKLHKSNILNVKCKFLNNFFLYSTHVERTVISYCVHPSQIRLLYSQRSLFSATIRNFSTPAYDSHVFAVGNTD